MIIRNIYYSLIGMICIVVTLSANISVKIKVHPKSIKAGDDLTVECLVYGTIPSNPLKTFFFCPFSEKKADHCYADCANICQHIRCTEKDKFIETFKCSWFFNENPRRFIYNILSITKEQINNRKILPFSCKFMGLEASENIAIEENSEPYIDPKYNVYTSITQKLKITTALSTKMDNKDLFHYGLRDIILIVLVLSLLTSFFINIWCCVQWCIWRAKYKKRKESRQAGLISDNNNQITSQSNFQINSCNDSDRNEMRYIPIINQDDYMRRARSQPALLNNERNTPVKTSASNLNKISGSMNNNLKQRYQICNSSINGIYQNGSIPEQMNPYGGQQMLGYFAPPYTPAYPYMGGPLYRMNTSQSEDLNEFTEDNLSENMQSSTNQPLPKKPDDRSMNIDSMSSSIIV